MSDSTNLPYKDPPDAAVIALGQRLSVFLSNFNHGRYLPRALDGLLNQTVPPAEICVIDDGSDDNSAQIIADYASRFPVIRAVYRPRNIGVFANLSRWLTEVETEFVYFAAADDYVMPRLFEQSLRLMAQFPQAALCSSLIMLADESGSTLTTFQTPRPCTAPCFISPDRAQRLLMADDSWMVGNSTIYRLAKLRDAGGFDARLAGFSDGFASRLLVVRHGACFIPEPLAVWRRSETGIAGQTLVNPAAGLQIGTYVLDLFNSPAGQEFAEGYARRWHGRWRYAIAVRGLSVAGPSPLAGLEAALGPPKMWDRAALTVLRRMTRGQSALATIYAFLRFRPFDVWPVLSRRLSYLVG